MGQTPLDFIFVEPGENDSANLRQGDLLLKTPELANALAEAHPYYAEADDYSHFLVLTQSCDLVRRGGECKSRYVTLCAVRPMALAAAREIEKIARNNVSDVPLVVGDASRRILAQQYLDRVINNTVDGIFFIPKYSAPTVEEHLAAFLHLSVALGRQHYAVCLGAKIGQLRDIFAAKVGSLLGDLYNRIGTPDIHEESENKQVVQTFKEEFYEEMGLDSVYWLSDQQQRELKKRAKEARKIKGDLALTVDEATSLVADLPGEREALAERAIEVLRKRRLFPDDDEKAREGRKLLENDPTFKRLSKPR